MTTREAASTAADREEGRASVLSQEQFEELARFGERVDEALRLEFVNGRIREKPMPDGDHAEIIAWLTRLCIKADEGWWLHAGRGLRVGTYRKSNARPAGCLAPSENFVGLGEWTDAEGVLMAVEITSRDHATHRRDRVEKPKAYAETGIPVYLLIDRDTCEVKVHSQPDGGRYEMLLTVPFGKTVTLPDPVGIELDTEPLKDWVR
ncbi:Uma2 family endonuclease [Streptomyces paromomycinus]|nr:Uma2 family endonuclease [Streptomyces paromomycinus]